jgi:hypothetical protein
MIVLIELPMPKNKWLDVARLQVHSNYMKHVGFSEVAKMDENSMKRERYESQARMLMTLTFQSWVT